jgi:hypothetical protein
VEGLNWIHALLSFFFSFLVDFALSMFSICVCSHFAFDLVHRNISKQTKLQYPSSCISAGVNIGYFTVMIFVIDSVRGRDGGFVSCAGGVETLLELASEIIQKETEAMYLDDDWSQWTNVEIPVTTFAIVVVIILVVTSPRSILLATSMTFLTSRNKSCPEQCYTQSPINNTLLQDKKHNEEEESQSREN